MRNIQGSKHADPSLRRQQLLDAAIICFQQEGYRNTTIASVAQQAGLSKGSVYRFFQSKEDLLFAVLDFIDLEMRQCIEDSIVDANGYADTIYKVIRATLYFLVEKQGLERFWYEIQQLDEVQTLFADMMREDHERLSSLLEQGIAAKEIRAVPIGPTSDMIMAYVEGILAFAMTGKEFDVKTRFEQSWPILQHSFVINSQA